ncbi:hypothetical protein A3D80_01125 [Candidatus Roizmanbacteria bacterium RIFCSPHIGHO2_02_FULL_40_13b]|uniref:Nucleotidyltransferase family protein n=1 Tax=Candidatus Roizmanbacteria bacterium RIFCSPHIGHO2_01_FULL_39_24 TaxID=1802032 RepID=A0A1F7GMD8_9BACT|nr:MAG: hypothetical protein A2799_01265 [Candidatus Roizmanbacteria bacterium RIFCSPHIGHO2_01_FULL_39_24]OGK26298.1 MAG: hypothetical protein A3D80_01125 [Candidatus Roizmanbacteria bacterium RIFCSPHIGHO2_02_FULL_40_13b]OGK49361.1 MAG: hypothetical protein A3A56_03755 [Candidatus Roizmanbacteria bacterium RIFCSPLOWO2_01_FULL_40_32]
MTEKDIIKLIRQDEWMMKKLRAVQKPNLPDWYIGAGFVRSKIWDTLHGYKKRTPIPDIDVIYFDKNDFSEEELQKDSTAEEVYFQNLLSSELSGLQWSVTNQARMHIFHDDVPYTNSVDALSKWVETATCIGVRVEEKDTLILVAPHGIDDLVNLIIRPTLKTKKNMQEFTRRLNEKKWLQKWPKLKTIY